MNLKAARRRIDESGLRNVTLLPGDAQSFAFEPAAFDIATSRMGVMFFAEPVTAFRNIRGALKPDGRLVFACWASLAEKSRCAYWVPLRIRLSTRSVHWRSAIRTTCVEYWREPGSRRSTSNGRTPPSLAAVPRRRHGRL